ncbi:hypothetical protein IP92_03181 [Pseudoduganella flava]|nr:hypothetical protein IP92_03181 [Pseudoduganella flava]
MERDAAAAVAYLRTRKDIDPRRIALVGLSQGGVVAPVLAARDPAIAAVVTLAAPIGKRGAPFMLGLRSRLAAQGTPPTAIEHIAAAVHQWMEARLADAAPAEVARLRAGAVASFGATGATIAQAEGMVALLDTPALLSMYDSGTADDFQRIRVPVLALFGSGDDVLAPGTVAAAKAALDGHPTATIVEIAGVNHVFQEPGAAGVGLPAVSAPALLRLVPPWLAERLARPR